MFHSISCFWKDRGFDERVTKFQPISTAQQKTVKSFHYAEEEEDPEAKDGEILVTGCPTPGGDYVPQVNTAPVRRTGTMTTRGESPYGESRDNSGRSLSNRHFAKNDSERNRV